MTLRRLLTLTATALGLSLVPLVVLPPAQTAAADVDDFSFDEWNIDYEIRLEDGRARLHATETITARFPDSDQNRGIVRGLPTSYQNAKTNVDVLSVTDGSGREVPWELDEGYDETKVLTGDDEYVHGAQTYVIEYTMDDVVIAAQQTGVDEFYWDLLPTDRRQTIRDFSAQIWFDEEFTAELTGDSACYQGVHGSSDRCDLRGPTHVSGGSAFRLAIDELPAGSGATVAIGMTSGTVTQPDERLTDGGDYVIDAWDAEYRIGLDGQRRAVLHATETIVATFPESDRSHGIKRNLDATLMWAPTDARVLSVTDENGDDVPWRAKERSDALVLTTGADKYSDEGYLHGQHTFVIEYTMTDVILPPLTDRGEGRDRFRWDLLPGDAEPVSDATARIVFDDKLSAALTGQRSCSGDCSISGPDALDGGSAFTATMVASDERRGVSRGDSRSRPHGTVEIELREGAVLQPLPRRQEPVMTVLPHVLAGSGLAVGAAGGIGAIVAMRRRARRVGGTVIAQYEVPGDLPPVVAGALGVGTHQVEAAQIVHLAVRGVIRFTETDGANVQAELVQPVHSSSEAGLFDQQSQRALFGGEKHIGATRTFRQNDVKFAKRMRDLREAGEMHVISRELITKRRSRLALLLSGGALLIALATLALAIVGLSLSMRGADVALASAIVAVVLLIAAVVVFCFRFRVVTPNGAELATHLEGVKLFITVAESRRIEMLQSYKGADRLPDGEVDVIRVYEKLLPYAMLFGNAKDWGQVLEVAYARERATPRWASHPGASIAATAQFVASGVQASATLPSSSGPSSSAGGSTGGGFSGGGGGGGSVGGR